MSCRVHLPALLSLLALAACAPRHAERGPGAEAPAAADVPGTPPAAAAGETPSVPDDEATFRWDDAAGSLDLGGALRGTPVVTGATGPWTSRAVGARATGSRSVGATARGARVARRPALRAPSGDDRAFAAESFAAAPPIDAAPPSGLGVMESAARAGGVAIDAGAMRGRSSMAVAPVPSASPLRAGSTDDNADLAAYTAFVDEWSAPGRLRAPVDRLDISDARTIQVTDPVGRPVPGARVSVTDLAADRIVWTGTTYGDGTAPWYPNLRAGLLGEAPVDGSLGYAVQAEHGGVFTTRQVGSGTDTVRMVLDESASGPTQLDVVFLVDTTGSMGDEIDRIKSTLLSTTARVRSLDDDVDLRYGAVLYRDIGDEYVTRAHPLTGDIQGFDAALQAIRAGGGGDGPESLNQGLAVAVDTMAWREDAARLVFVVADAPPHMDYQGDVTYGRSALAALHKGIRIHTVAASGLDDHGSLVFRQTAQLSQGHFIFIEYGSAAASAADHGVRGSVQSNNLDDILYRKIEAEVTGWGGDAGLAVRHRR